MGGPAPIMLDLRGAFLGANGPALMQRHRRYGLALAEVSGDPSAALAVAVPSRRAMEPGPSADCAGVRLIKGIPQGHPRFWKRGLVPGMTERPTLWIASDPFTTGPLQLAAAQRNRSRLQVQTHGDFGMSPAAPLLRIETAKSRVAARVLARADSVRAVSQMQAEALIARFKLNPDRVFVAPVPLDVAFTETPTTVAPREPRILFVGRLHKERGLGLWAQSASLIARRNPGVAFDIVGSGPEEEVFRALLADVPDVTWHGTLSPSKVAALMARSRVLLSTPPLESYGRSLSEALCMGLMVTATRTKGAQRLADEVGVLFGDTPRELAEAVETLLESSPQSTESAKFRQTQRTRDIEAITTLVRSWL